MWNSSFGLPFSTLRNFGRANFLFSSTRFSPTSIHTKFIFESESVTYEILPNNTEFILGYIFAQVDITRRRSVLSLTSSLTSLMKVVYQLL